MVISIMLLALKFISFLSIQLVLLNTRRRTNLRGLHTRYIFGVHLRLIPRLWLFARGEGWPDDTETKLNGSKLET